MAKACKIIVNFLVAVCILAVVVLLVPSLVGVETVVAGPKLDSNIPEGTVVYGIRQPVDSINPEEKIVYSGDTFAYVYVLDEVDSDNNEVYVTDMTTMRQSVLQLRKNAAKVIVQIPYIGYLLIAMESLQGQIMLIAGVLLLMMLYITTQIWAARHKEHVYDEDDEEEDDQYFSDLVNSRTRPGALDALSDSPSVSGGSGHEEVSGESGYEEWPAENPPAEEPDFEKGAGGEFGDIRSLPTIHVEEKDASAAREAGAEELEDMLSELRGDKKEASAEVDAALLAELALGAAGGQDEKAAAKEEPAGNGSDEAFGENSEEMAGTEAKESGTDDGEGAGNAPIRPGEAAFVESVEQALKSEVKKGAKEESELYAEPIADALQGKSPEEVAEAIANVPFEESPAGLNMETGAIAGVSAALEAALMSAQVSRPQQSYSRPKAEPEVIPEKAPEEIELAMPVRTLDEYLEMAYAAGEDPQVITDSVTGVKFVDFSDCLK